MNIRQMEMSDADFMLELKNYPETRRFAIASHDEIKKEDHYKWLEENIISMQIIEGERGTRIGALRINQWEISIWIHRSFRSLNVAENALRKVMKPMMTAKIVEGNVPSMRAFIKAGFQPREHISELKYYIFQYL